MKTKDTTLHTGLAKAFDGLKDYCQTIVPIFLLLMLITGLGSSAFAHCDS